MTMNPKLVSIASTMTSPEKEVEAQLRFVFGNGVVIPQIQHIKPEDAEPQGSGESCSTEVLCLRRCDLKQVPDTVLRNSSLTYLCLEGNQITSIPDSMFVSLPKLEWLDLRKNLITSLPAEIGSHRSLKTLALEGNPISELPPELGNVTTLRALCLRDCPIRFPPPDVVQQGYQSILRYLRSVLAERAVIETKTSPAVEKLQLSGLMESNMEELEEESADEAEMKKFRELKDKFIQLDLAELSSTPDGDKKTKPQLPVVPKRVFLGLLKAQPADLTGKELPLALSKPPPRSALSEVSQRKNTITKAGIIPELPLPDAQQTKRPPERRSQPVLQKTRRQPKKTQEKKISEHKQKRQETQRKPEETDRKPTSTNRSVTSRAQACGTCTDTEEDRYARELQQQIRARAERMQERHRNPRGTMAEQMAVTEEDVEEMRRLQERLLERKRNRRTHCKKCFYTFTEDSWQSLFS